MIKYRVKYSLKIDEIKFEMGEVVGLVGMTSEIVIIVTCKGNQVTLSAELFGEAFEIIGI